MTATLRPSVPCGVTHVQALFLCTRVPSRGGQAGGIRCRRRAYGRLRALLLAGAGSGAVPPRLRCQSLHRGGGQAGTGRRVPGGNGLRGRGHPAGGGRTASGPPLDRKSTRLNSSHVRISYAVFCLKKKKTT